MDSLTVHEVSELAKVSVRTLHHYDNIGLLVPSARSQAGYRLYGANDLARLQQILLFRELEFPLEDIRRVLDSPDFDQAKALDQQIELLQMRRDHINGLIDMAKDMREKGAEAMSFEPFDTSKMDKYAAQAKAHWGDTPQWAEYEQRRAVKSEEGDMTMGERLMSLFLPFGRMAAKDAEPSCDEALAQVAEVQSFITENYYTCTDEVLAGLGVMYGSGGDFTRNIDAAAGPGAAEFAAAAIGTYCAKGQ